ncbi:RnfH family protein [Aquabacterium sp.]|uniref:RnfH family protein n=1 Tax=Aquabacterium sp. TaxID=1872578 RepID=UPI003D6D5451
MAPVEPADGPRAIQVEVVFSPASRQVESITVSLPAGSTVHDALQGAGLLERVQGLSLGIWGRRTTLGQVLQDRDRVEAYRGLIVDPKEARRVRYKAHREKLPKGVSRSKVRPAPESSD